MEEIKSWPRHPDESAFWTKFIGSFDKKFRGVEIGTLYGDQAYEILNSSDLVYLISIDPFIPDSMAPALLGDFYSCMEKNKEFGKRFILIKDYSYNAVITFKDKSLDFIFIDGDHTYDACMMDYKDWYPKIKIGGYIMMHDSRLYREGGPEHHPGSSQVTLEMIYNQPEIWEIIAEPYCLTVAKKLK